MADDATPDIQVDSVEEVACHRCGNVSDVSDAPAFSVAECPHCGATFSVPGKLGDFVLLKVLGRGGMGTTYKAYEKALGRFVAIKVMHPALAEDQVRVREFLSEAKTLASLNHPHVVRAYSLGEAQGRPYIVMEFVDGKRLDRTSRLDKPMDELQALEIGVQLADALAAACRIGLIHGDVKPGNILLDANGEAKLVDFGVARFGGGRFTENDALGTPYYVSPEQVRRESIDPRTDIYSLGATLFRCLACSPPFEGDSMTAVLNARLEAPAPDLRGFRPGLHPKTANIVARMLETDLENRYAGYEELRADLLEAYRLAGGAGELEAEDGSAAAAPSALVAWARQVWARFHLPLIIGASAVAAAAMVVAAILLMPSRETPPARQPKAAKPAPPPWKAPEDLQTARPVFTPPGRAITEPTDVTISCPTRGAEIRYTTDGNDPTEQSPVVTGPIPVRPGMTLRARAYREDRHPSEVAEAAYPGDSALVADVVPVRTEASRAWDRTRRLDRGQGFRAKLEQGQSIHANAEELYRQGAYKASKAQYEKLLALCRELGDLARDRESARTARQAATSAIESVLDPDVRKAGDSPWQKAGAAARQAEAAFERGDFVQARRLWASAERDAKAQQAALVRRAREGYEAALKGHDASKLASLAGAAWQAVTGALSQAREAEKTGQWAEAISQYTRARRLLARAGAAMKAAEVQAQVNAGLAKAKTLMAEGKLSEATKVVDETIPLKPWDVAVWRAKNAVQHRMSAALLLRRERNRSYRMRLMWIRPGQFEAAGRPMLGPRPRREVDRTVIISKPFYIGVREVTRKQFSYFVSARGEGYKTQAEKVGAAIGWDEKRKKWGPLKGAHWKRPGFEQKDDHPVACVTWREAGAFCEWLSKENGAKVSLPTEAQWEYACRAGTDTPFSFGSKEEDLPKHANYADRSRTRRGRGNDGFVWTAPVGKFEPNAWRLFDMHGNVREWCRDWYAAGQAVGADPAGPPTGKTRVVRGGGWDSPPSSCRSSSRTSLSPSYPSCAVGFRVVATDVPAEAFAGKPWRAVPPEPPPPDVHIADLRPIKASTGWQKVRVNRSCRGKALRLNGKEYAKGMGVHAPSELVYACKPEYERFVGVAGLDGEIRSSHQPSVRCKVYADEGLLAESPLLKNRIIHYWHFDVPIPPGTKRIRLVVTDGGDGNQNDHGDWANAGFLTARL